MEQEGDSDARSSRPSQHNAGSPPPSQHNSGSPPPSQQSEKKNYRKRGPTSLTIGSKSKNGKKRKISIKFNEKEEPIGNGRKSLATDVGRIFRAHAPINCQKWKDVPASIKAKMRELIEENYKCKSKVNWQDTVMDLVGGRFQSFKHRLYKKYIRPNLHNLHKIRDPPTAYTTITKDKWRDFIAQRTTKGWSQKESRVEEPIERHVLWKEARKDKNREFKDEHLREKAQKIDEISQQVADGTLTTEGSNDVLTQALGSKEHSGRVRGVGGLVTPSMFFRRSTNASKALKSALKELAQVKNLYEALVVEVKKLGGQPPPPNGTLLSPNAERVASNSAKFSAVRIETPPVSSPSQGLDNSKNKPRKCKLALGSLDRVVANGTLFDTGGPNLIHGCVLGEGNVEVLVDSLVSPEYANEQLLIPTTDATILRKAIGGFVAWPRKLVILRSDVENKNAPSKNGKVKAPSNKEKVNAPSKKENMKAPSKVDVVASNFESLLLEATKHSPDKAIYIVVDDQVFRTDDLVFRTDDPDFEPIVEVPLFRDQLMDVINCKEIGVDVILLYMCLLYTKAKELGIEGKVRFLLPAGSRGHQELDNSNVFFEYIESIQPGQIFLYPYNTGFHWVLVVVDPWM